MATLADLSSHGLLTTTPLLIPSIWFAGRAKGTAFALLRAKTGADIDAFAIRSLRGAGLYTDYTFALWDDGKLVNFAKAYSGLTNEEIERVDNWIRRSTVRRAGPVREVKPELVFELGFEGVQVSARHKSGLAVRFPRILRWREDKKAAEADVLEALRRFAGVD